MNILKALYPRRSLFGAFHYLHQSVARYTPCFIERKSLENTLVSDVI